MAQGWSPLVELESQDPDTAIDPSAVERVCCVLTRQNEELHQSVIDALFEKRFDDYAIELRTGYRNSDRDLFNRYFGVCAYSPCVPAYPPRKIDGPRTAVLFYLSFDLQNHLVNHLRQIPTSELAELRPKLSTSKDRDSEQLSNSRKRVYRFVELGRAVRAIKNVQYDVEDFAFRATHLLIGSGGSTGSFRTSNWPYEFEVQCESILLGLVRGPEGVIDPWLPTSSIVAAGVLRSHLETVLFRRDLGSALKRLKPPEITPSGNKTPAWEATLKAYRDRGILDDHEYDWVQKSYNLLLSESLHAGFALSSGEVWMLRRVVQHLADRLASSRESREVT